MMKKTLAVFFALGLGFAIAQEAPAAAPAKEAAPAEKPARPQRNPAEIAARRQEFMKQRLQKDLQELVTAYDKNQDGKIDAAEKAAMEDVFAEAQKTMRFANIYRRMKMVDTNGDFAISPEEFDAAKDKPMFGPGMGGGRPGMGMGPRGGMGGGRPGMGPRGGRGPREGRGPRPEGDKPAPAPAE